MFSYNTHETPICNAFVDVMYSGVSGQCSHTIYSKRNAVHMMKLKLI